MKNIEKLGLSQFCILSLILIVSPLFLKQVRGGCSQGFGIAPRVLEYNVKIYPNFYEKSFIKGTLKPKIEKGLCYPLFTDFVKIFAAYTLKIVGKC